LLVEALARAKSPPTFARVLDLGCGTGQMAKALDRSAQSIIGVDLSARMLVEAEKTGLYAALHRAELLKFLAGEAAASADLIIAADVFCYVPDLWPVFTESARVLMTGGTLAFTVQTHAGEGVIVGEDSRMHHAPRHVEALLAQSGLAVLELRDASSRKDRGIDVPGAVFVSMKA
jgi:predicted TPR repeat methyltransferase